MALLPPPNHHRVNTETKRQRQVAEILKRNFSLVLQQEGPYVFGPEPLVTVTEVKVSPDLSVGKVYLSIWNTENKQAVMLQMAEEHPRLKQALAQRTKRHLRRLPELAYFQDETLDEMYKVNGLFDRLYAENQMPEPRQEEE
ncbi:MAG: 30S ribosome-binding factor RbfA [Lewinella sp.]|nr:30S ribosome-binding factor RbfA [Lewinella sp.]